MWHPGKSAGRGCKYPVIFINLDSKYQVLNGKKTNILPSKFALLSLLYNLWYELKVLGSTYIYWKNSKKVTTRLSDNQSRTQEIIGNQSIKFVVRIICITSCNFIQIKKISYLSSFPEFYSMPLKLRGKPLMISLKPAIP